MPKSQSVNLRTSVTSSMTLGKRKWLVLCSIVWLSQLTIIILEWSLLASVDDTVVVLGSGSGSEEALSYRSGNPLAGMVWSAASFQTLGGLCFMWQSLLSGHPRALQFVGCAVLALSTILFIGAVACCYALYRAMDPLAVNYTRGDGPQHLLIFSILNLLCWLLLGLSHQLRQRSQGTRANAETKGNSRPFEAKGLADMSREHSANAATVAQTLEIAVPKVIIV